MDNFAARTQHGWKLAFNVAYIAGTLVPFMRRFQTPCKEHTGTRAL